MKKILNVLLVGFLTLYGFSEEFYLTNLTLKEEYNRGGLHGLGVYSNKKNHLSLDDLDNVLIDNGIPVKDYIPKN